METQEQAKGYEETAYDPYLDRLDNEFVDQVLSLGVTGTILDLGTGPGQIPIKLAKREPRIKVIGVDMSAAMLSAAAERAERERLSSRVSFILADAKAIPLANASVNVLLCNSTLHHFSNPVLVFDEADRVVKKDGVIYFRDLRRPPRILHSLHVSFFGRNYEGLMRKLFEASVRASYTRPELSQLIARSKLSDAKVFYPDLSHIVVERRGDKRERVGGLI